MKTAVVVGMKSEAAIIGQRPDTVVISGAGDAARLAADLEAAIAGGCDHVLSFGTCGALNQKLKAAQIVVGWRLLGVGPTISANRDWSVNLEGLSGGSPVSAAFALATVSTAAQKAAFFAATGADVIDLESYVAANGAKAHNLPFAMLRAVSDTADQAIPPAAMAALNAEGGIDFASVIASLAANDAQIPALFKLADSSALAFNALARALANIGMNYGAPA